MKTCPQCHQECETPFCPLCGLRLDTVLVPCPNCQAMVPPARHCQECGWKLAEEAVGGLGVRCNDGLQYEMAEITGPRRDHRTDGFSWLGKTPSFGDDLAINWFGAKFEDIPVGQWTVKVGPYRQTVEIYANQWEEVDFLDEDLSGNEDDEDDN